MSASLFLYIKFLPRASKLIVHWIPPQNFWTGKDVVDTMMQDTFVWCAQGGLILGLCVATAVTVWSCAREVELGSRFSCVSYLFQALIGSFALWRQKPKSCERRASAINFGNIFYQTFISSSGANSRISDVRIRSKGLIIFSICGLAFNEFKMSLSQPLLPIVLLIKARRKISLSPISHADLSFAGC